MLGICQCIIFACNDEYLDRFPEDKINDANFWKNKVVVVKPLAPKGRKLREGQKPNPPKDWYKLTK